jgi:ribonuclease VapC
MFIDASALIAMMIDEADAKTLAGRLEQSTTRLTSPVAVFETAAAVARELALPVEDALAETKRFLSLLGIQIMPIPVDAGDLAVETFARYGKGCGHPAQLNMGDCFAYACAQIARQPLLIKGRDFTETDITPA